MSVDSSLAQPASIPASWTEVVPKWYKLLRAGLAGGLAIGFCVLLLLIQFGNGADLDFITAFWFFVVAAVGVWRCRYWLALSERIRYATQTVPLPLASRFRKALPVLLLGFGGFGTVIWLQSLENRLHDYWWYGLPLLALGFGGLLYVMLKRTETRLTDEAVKVKAALEYKPPSTEPATPSKIEELGEKLLSIVWVRYLLAASCFWGAYESSQVETFDKRQTLFTLVLVGLGLWLSKEAALWLAGLAVVVGLFALLFAGVAALPLGVAVIIGALIIASAMRR